MRNYTSEELKLLARIQKETGQLELQEATDVIHMCRNGMSCESVIEEVDRSLSDNLFARVTVQDWIRKHCSCSQPEIEGNKDSGYVRSEGPKIHHRIQSLGGVRK